MTMGEEIDRLREIRDAQALMIERLRAALKPFAEAGRTLLDEPDDTGVITDPITVGDFRRAAKALDNEQTPRTPEHGEIIECTQCGGPVAFGDCCNACDKPTDE